MLSIAVGLFKARPFRMNHPLAKRYKNVPALTVFAFLFKLLAVYRLV